MAPSIMLDKSEADFADEKPSKNGVTPIPKPENSVISSPLPNPSLQVTADHQLKAVEAPVYSPREGEVLLHIKATGVCG